VVNPLGKSRVFAHVFHKSGAAPSLNGVLSRTKLLHLRCQMVYKRA
jgi:hypothetical protein